MSYFRHRFPTAIYATLMPNYATFPNSCHCVLFSWHFAKSWLKNDLDLQKRNRRIAQTSQLFGKKAFQADGIFNEDPPCRYFSTSTIWASCHRSSMAQSGTTCCGSMAASSSGWRSHSGGTGNGLQKQHPQTCKHAIIDTTRHVLGRKRESLFSKMCHMFCKANTEANRIFP